MQKAPIGGLLLLAEVNENRYVDPLDYKFNRSSCLNNSPGLWYSNKISIGISFSIIQGKDDQKTLSGKLGLIFFDGILKKSKFKYSKIIIQ